MPLRHFIVAVSLAGVAGAAVAQDDLTTLTLSSGETIRVRVLERTPESLRVEHPLLGDLTVPAAEVQSLAGAPYEPPVEQIAAQPEEAAGVVPEPDPVWDSELSLGIDGSEGNTEDFNLRAEFRTERLIEDVERFAFLSRYTLETDNGDRNENEWYNRASQEWFLPESPRWSWFIGGDAEYDEFETWDLRVSAQTGPSYLFIDDETTTLRGRVGLGGAYEFGAEDERLIPELFLGYGLEHDLDDRSRITSNGGFFLDLEEGDEFRSIWDAAYEVDMTEAGDWRLRLGVQHEYDSDSDVTPWDLDYFVALVLGF
jgi:hypothetical protein